MNKKCLNKTDQIVIRPRKHPLQIIFIHYKSRIATAIRDHYKHCYTCTFISRLDYIRQNLTSSIDRNVARNELGRQKTIKNYVPHIKFEHAEYAVS